MAAARSGLADAVKPLLAAGAGVNAKDENGETALDVAKSDEAKAAILQKAQAKKSGKGAATLMTAPPFVPLSLKYGRGGHFFGELSR